jgi:hypothetical protein
MSKLMLAFVLDIQYYRFTMTNTDYKVILEQAKKDLLSGQEALGKCFKQQEEIEKWITGLRQTIAALSRMLDEEFVEEDAMGLTDAIRTVFRDKLGSGTLIPTEVRDYLVTIGYDITKYGNVMASVHSVINRLLDKGEIAVAGTRADNKTAYKWVYKLAGPPGRPSGELSHEELMSAIQGLANIQPPKKK